MLCQRRLFYLSELLNKIKCDVLPFGGVTVLLIGNIDQLPLVQGDPLCSNNTNNKDDVNGNHLLLLFDTIFELEENMILDQNNRHAVEFYKF